MAQNEITLETISPSDGETNIIESTNKSMSAVNTTDQNSESLSMSTLKIEKEDERKEEESEDKMFYIVQEGDTLIRVSIKLNISVARLKKYNHLFGKNDLIVGQRLRTTEKPEVHEKPFILLKDSHINSSFREREKLKQSTTMPLPKKSEMNSHHNNNNNGMSETDELHRHHQDHNHHHPVPSLSPPVGSSLSSSLSAFRYKAISDPNLCLHIEDEIHIFPRRRSVGTFYCEREREIGIEDEFSHFDFDLTDDEKAGLEEIPDIPGLTITPKSILTTTSSSTIEDMSTSTTVLVPVLPPPSHPPQPSQPSLSIPPSSSATTQSAPPTPNTIQRLRSLTRQISLPLSIHIIDSITSQILTHSHIHSLLRHLPLFLQNDGWKLLYSILLYGDDLSSFYQYGGGSKYSLVIIKTYDGQIFGGFATESWKIQKTHMFYGTGESFVFMIHNKNDSVEVFDWKYSNYFFQWSSSEQVAMGGGGGQFGFVLGNDLLQGETNPCETYGNPHLTTHRGVFDILEVEVWGFESYCKPHY